MPPRSADPRRTVLALGIGLAALTAAPSADAYCLTSVCNSEFAGSLCNPPQAADCGTALFWGQPCFSFSMQEDGSNQIDFATAEALMNQAFNTWENADCGGGAAPSVRVDNLGSVSCDQVEYNQDGGNANVVTFRDGEWPYTTAGNALALTTVTFNRDTAEIVDADLEVNSTAMIQLTTSDNDVLYDMLSIFTHEAGHMLGIAHTDVLEATMTIEYVPGDISLRLLHPDDMNAICAAFPPGTDVSSCDSEPRRGLATECGGDPPAEEGCGCRVVGPERGRGWGGLALAGLGLALAARRRRRA